MRVRIDATLHIGSLPGYLQGIQDSLQGGVLGMKGMSSYTIIPITVQAILQILRIVIPCFHGGELVGFGANTAHHLDIGAATPGLIIDIPDVYAEGMLFAGTKLYDKGVRNEAIWNFLTHNSRANQQLKSDIEAQVASARLGCSTFS